MSLVCPVCEQGSLHAEIYSDEFQHNGKPLRVTDLERYRCDRCGADPVLTDQIKRNQLRICDQKRRADGYLTSTEIKAIRERLRLSQSEAAALFGGGPNAFSKYERGEVIQGLSMDRLIRSAAHFPLVVGFLRSLTADSSEKTVVAPDAYTSTSELSLNDPWYTSKPVSGRTVLVSERDVSCNVISLPRKRVA
jgi:HTH-type transcriptional regulator/antitoxin MqsA